MAVTSIERTQRFVSRPRTTQEMRVFIECEVSEAGLRLRLPVDVAGNLRLATSAQVAILQELVTAAHRRLLEIELTSLPHGVTHGFFGAAAAPVGAAGEAGAGPGPPI